MSKKYSVLIVFLSIILSSNQALFSALVEGMLVKMPHGLMPVEQLQVGDSVVVCRAGSANEESSVKKITQTKIQNVRIIKTDNTTLSVSADQLLYEPIECKWILAKQLTTGNKLLDFAGNHINCVDIQSFDATITLYDLTLDSPHTFFISHDEILTHNFLPIIFGFTWAFGSGISFTGLTVGLAGVATGLCLRSKNRKCEVGLGDVKRMSSGSTSSPSPEDPEKQRKKLEETLQERRKEAMRIARKMGFTETKDYNFNSHGEKVYKKGRTYITLDNTSHKGGFWKKCTKNGRLGTFDKTLKIEISG